MPEAAWKIETVLYQKHSIGKLVTAYIIQFTCQNTGVVFSVFVMLLINLLRFLLILEITC